MSKRILHVLSGLEVGGKERIALELASRAAASGHQASLLLFDTPFRDATIDFDPGPLPTEFVKRRAGIDFAFARELASRLERVDVVHAHNDTAVFYCGLALYCVARRPRSVATFHTRPGYDTFLGRTLTRFFARRFDRRLAVSSDLAEFLVRRGWVGRCDTEWNGIDLEAFTPAGPGAGIRAAVGFSSADFVIGHIGRCDPVKRHVDLLDAFAALPCETARASRLLLMGDGPLRGDLERRIAGEPAIRLLPRVQDVAGALREVDLFVLCSAVECAPRVLLEAMACGRSIVATDVGGVRRMLEFPDGRLAGSLVPPGDPKALAAAIERLRSDPGLRAELAKRARERASAFSSDREWSAYLRHYGCVESVP